MRLAALAICLLAGCATLPPADMPYFATTASGDNLYPATETRIYQNDQKVAIEEPHPSNNDRGRQTVSDAAGGFGYGLAALNASNDVQAPQSGPIGDPDACCHVFVQRDYYYFDGTTRIGIPQLVWRQAAGIPPFVDEPILRN